MRLIHPIPVLATFMTGVTVSLSDTYTAEQGAIVASILLSLYAIYSSK